ncbi:hypothetical protein LOK49_LG03G03821 [Camellia lanceoleosa]|uniref:Uncharacterized protein n=1 Tax=Camellia lanceoleosa TaxID=1840588 RepID=A0ACC0I5X3_9ERIC|nr:hypothetical protein LOK49_LG03G03821 [Camellia lanceoleosa]
MEFDEYDYLEKMVENTDPQKLKEAANGGEETLKSEKKEWTYSSKPKFDENDVDLDHWAKRSKSRLLDEAEFSKFHSGVKRGDIVGVIGYPEALNMLSLVSLFFGRFRIVDPWIVVYPLGEEIIMVIPWDEWWELSLKDESNPQVVLLPLHPNVRAKFNSTAAWAYARSMAGKPYGYHNMIFSWIDTIADNYPPPLDAHLVISVMSMWTRVQPAYTANIWNEALNKRLGTEKEARETLPVRFDAKLVMGRNCVHVQ